MSNYSSIELIENEDGSSVKFKVTPPDDPPHGLPYEYTEIWYSLIGSADWGQSDPEDEDNENIQRIHRLFPLCDVRRLLFDIFAPKEYIYESLIGPIGLIRLLVRPENFHFLLWRTVAIAYSKPYKITEDCSPVNPFIAVVRLII